MNIRDIWTSLREIRMRVSGRSDEELYLLLESLLDSVNQILLYHNRRGLDLDFKTRLKIEYKIRNALKISRILILRHNSNRVIDLRKYLKKKERLDCVNWRKYKKLNEYKKCRPLIE